MHSLSPLDDLNRVDLYSKMSSDMLFIVETPNLKDGQFSIAAF